MASASATAKARPAIKARPAASATAKAPLSTMRAELAELHRRTSQLRPLAPAVTASQARPKARPAAKAKRASAVKGIQLRPKSSFRATHPASKGASASKTASATNMGSKGSHKGGSATDKTGKGASAEAAEWKGCFGLGVDQLLPAHGMPICSPSYHAARPVKKPRTAEGRVMVSMTTSQAIAWHTQQLEERRAAMCWCGAAVLCVPCCLCKAVVDGGGVVLGTVDHSPCTDASAPYTPH